MILGLSQISGVDIYPNKNIDNDSSVIAFNVKGYDCVTLSNYLSEKFDIQINVHDKPEYAVVLGGGTVISDRDLVKKICLKLS